MRIAIIGAGKLGGNVVEALEGGNYSVTVMDKDSEALQRLSSQTDIMTVTANGKQISSLEEMGIKNYDYLLAATADDEKNIFIASAAKSLGCSKVIARVRDPEHVNQFDFIKETMHIDSIVNPDLLISTEIYKYLAEKYTLGNGIFSSGKVSLLEFHAYRMRKLIGLSMAEIGEALPNMLVVGISRNGKVIIPHGNTIVEEADGLYVIGERAPIMALNSKVHEHGKYTNIKKVMIIGGGKTGLFLARKLSEFGASVKIIESDKARCQYLSTRLNSNVMVLHGNATDIELLVEENIDDMDAVVTATGYDENNLMLALIAKQRGIDEVIAKISRESYVPLIEHMGIDMALNPLDITTSTILRFIQGGKTVLSSQLIQGQAEITEIIASPQMKFVGEPLRNLKLPQGMLIAAVHRGKNVIIPNGNTVIKEGDKVIIICLLTELPELEKLLRTGGSTGLFK